MTVRTEKTKIDQPVIVIDTVNVVQLEAEPFTSPLSDPAKGTLILAASPQQSLDDPVTTVFRRILDEYLLIPPGNATSVLGDARTGLFRQTLRPALALEMLRRYAEEAKTAPDHAVIATRKLEAKTLDDLSHRGTAANDWLEQLSGIFGFHRILVHSEKTQSLWVRTFIRPGNQLCHCRKAQ
jgi:hypothetical protein